MSPSRKTSAKLPALAKAPTGIQGLDEITNGGLPRGRPTLIYGAAGSGKTLIGMEFLVNGTSRYNEPGVFMSFEESEGELTANVASLGFDLKGLVDSKKLVIDQVAVERSEIEETGEYDLEGLFVRLGSAIDTIKAKRVVLDTIEVLFSGLTNTGIIRAELRRLFRWLKEKGVTTIITGERGGETTLTRHGLEEYVSDCVIFLDNRVTDELSTRRLRIVKYGGSFISTMTETNRWVKMYQSKNLEFVVMQDCHWQSETKFGDVILPASTNFEHTDLSEWNSAGGYGSHDQNNNHRIIIYQQQCIEPLWESKPDYEIYTLLADRLGIKDEYTEGNSFEDWNKKVFEFSDLPKYISYEAFKKKGYFVVPSMPPNEEPRVSFRWYYEGRPNDLYSEPKNNPMLGTPKAHLLATPSGKVEFVSRTLLEFDPNDKERPPMPRYIPSWEGYNTKELTKDYPLQIISPHPRFSYHTHNDNKSPWLDDIPQHRFKKDGYAYWPVRIHPADAEKRNIKDGDIVKVFNARGGVLCAAHVTERVRPGTVHSYEAGAKYDPLEPGKAGSIDRGGCINLLTPSRMVSKNAPGEAQNSCLVEITKWEA